MSPWFTLIVGIIAGLLAGWLLDRIARWRYEMERDNAADPFEGSREWTIPLPDGQSGVRTTTTNLGADLDAPAPLAAASTPEPRLPGVTAAATIAMEAAGPVEPADVREDAALDVPPASETASVTREAPGVEGGASWPEMAQWVDELARRPSSDQETDAPDVSEAERSHVSDEIQAGGPLSAQAIEALAPTTSATPSQSDNLILIEGIGPTYDARLRAAGIDTFRKLASAGEERLREIIQPQSWQRVNFAEWIEQAQLLAEGREDELRELQGRMFTKKKPKA